MNPDIDEPYQARLKSDGKFFRKRIIDQLEVYTLDPVTFRKYNLFDTDEDAIAFFEEKAKKGYYPDYYNGGRRPIVETHEEFQNEKLTSLPSGIYNYTIVNDEYAFVKTDLRKDNLSFIPKVSQDIKDRINQYINKKKVFDELGYPFRTSYLVYGPPGTGKTTLIRNIINDFESQDSIIIFTTQPIFTAHRKILNLDPRLKFVIVEEMTHVLSNPAIMRHFLDFLDGENSLINAITIATTNYPEKLPENLVNRRGRFDRFYKIDKMLPEENKIFTENILKREINAEEQKVINKMNISEIKDLCMSHLIEGISFNDYLKDLEVHKENYKRFFEEYKQLGMGIGGRR